MLKDRRYRRERVQATGAKGEARRESEREQNRGRQERDLAFARRNVPLLRTVRRTTFMSDTMANFPYKLGRDGDTRRVLDARVVERLALNGTQRERKRDINGDRPRKVSPHDCMTIDVLLLFLLIQFSLFFAIEPSYLYCPVFLSFPHNGWKFSTYPTKPCKRCRKTKTLSTRYL